jgi:dehydrodolichyl diphosphate syntase complex subunit NUS1
MLVYLSLRLLHIIYASLVCLQTRFQGFRYSLPRPVTAYRSRLPKHLAIILVSNDRAHPKHTEELYLECLARVATWCRALGIEQLTAYDADGKLFAGAGCIIHAKQPSGVLVRCSDIIQGRLAHDIELPTDESETELEYPLTPPHSEPSESRSHSPDFRESSMEFNVTTMRSFQKGISHRQPREVAIRRRRRSPFLESK